MACAGIPRIKFYGLRHAHLSLLLKIDVHPKVSSERAVRSTVAITLSGAFAGVAGGLYLFSKGNTHPDVLAIPQSIDALLMVLMGGVNSLAGPLVGGAVFTWLHDEISRFEYWRWILGLIIVAIVILFPKGISGSLRDHLGERLGFVRREE